MLKNKIKSLIKWLAVFITSFLIYSILYQASAYKVISTIYITISVHNLKKKVTKK